ncbi:MAG: 50S ribosomal protein L4 [Gammaproteobacteria bacterium]
MAVALNMITPKSSKPHGTVDAIETAFGTEFNEGLIHQLVVAYQAAGRQGTSKTKNRHEVSGGGRKPWRQKGTGRARAGTIRSPIWVGGGHAFAKRPRNFKQKVNKKMYRAGIRSILSELHRQNALYVVDSLEVKEPKTKVLLNQLTQMDTLDVLIVMEHIEENMYLASRNIPKVSITDVAGLNPVNLLAHKKVIITKEAIKEIEEWLK